MTAKDVPLEGAAARIAPFVAALLAFLVMAALYVAGAKPIYDALLVTWGVDPFAFPFLDTDTVLSAVRCLRQGVDVFAVNPCDVLGRVFDYSPLWLVLAKLPVTTAWIAPVGLIVDIAFLLSLLLLPPARSRVARAFLILGVLSSAVVFAVERGNNDLVLFALAALAAWLAGRSPALRSAGYAAALLAGLLKYYPMTLMLLATRERPVRFLAVTAASLAAVALFLMTMGPDLVRALALVPVGSWFGDMFGSSTLAGGSAQLLGWSAKAASALHILMSLAALAIGLAIGLSARTGTALSRLSDSEKNFLLVGALLILSCFFTAQNIGYRATHLVLVLPALTALCRTDRSRLWPIATAASLALLWAQGWRALLDHVDSPAITILGWLTREALWWTVVTILIALVAGLLARSTMARFVFSPRRASVPA